MLELFKTCRTNGKTIGDHRILHTQRWNTELLICDQGFISASEDMPLKVLHGILAEPGTVAVVGELITVGGSFHSQVFGSQVSHLGTLLGSVTYL